MWVKPLIVWGSVAAAVFLGGVNLAQGEPPVGGNPISEEEKLAVEDSVVLPPLEISDATDAEIPIPAYHRHKPVVGGVPMEGILDIALEKSPDLAVQRSRLSESRMRALATGLLPNPVVTGGIKKVSGGDDGPLLEVEQELPVTGVRKFERRAAELEYDANRRLLLRQTQVILTGVQRAVVDVLAARERLGVELESLEISKGSLDIVSDRYKSGVVSTLPYSLAKAEYSNAQKSYQLAEKEVLLARQRLARLIGIEEADMPPIAGNLHESLLPANLDPSEYYRPDRIGASLRVQSAQASVSAARRARIPNPVLGYAREEAGTDTENFFSVGLEIPILNTGVPLVRQRMAASEVVKKEKQALEISIESEQQQAWERLISRQEAVRVYEDEMTPSIRESLEAAKTAFQGGITDLSLLLQTQQRLIEMERGYVDTLRELRLAELDYLLALGIRKP